MDNCNDYNQYYTDVVVDGKIMNELCFKGSSVYPKMKTFSVNSLKNYNSKDYYSWINDNFKEYSFPEEDTFSCDLTDNYSLKQQQKFAGRIFNTYSDNRGMLVYHGLGSGKTQTSIVIGEAFKFRNTEDDRPIDNRADTRVLIVVPAALVEQYYSEIIGRIENGNIRSASGQILINGDRQYYFDAGVRSALESLYKEKVLYEKNEQKLKFINNQIRNLIEEERLKVDMVYEILSHERFLNRLFTIKEGQFEEKGYLQNLTVPNGLLIIDEIQNLVSAIGTSYRKLLYALRYYADKNFKVVLLTGTPIYDKPFEFGLLMNLLRPRLLFPDGHDAFNEVFLENGNIKNIELFKMMCSSYVSYFKGGNPELYPYKKTILMHHSMNPYQYSAYKVALLKEVDRDKRNEGNSNEDDFLVRMASSESVNDETITGIFTNSNLFSNIAFPEAKLTEEEKESQNRGESILKAGIREFKTVLKRKAHVDRQSPEDVKITRMLGEVSIYSNKFSKVAELILNSEGTAFVYSNFVYYGVDAMAIVLNFLGFTEFPNNSGLNGSYFIWKGKADPQQIIKAKKIFNSAENKDGSLLKVMFGTQTVMEGVDFKNVRQVHILDPWWNDSRMQQIIARSIRLCSHKDLPPSKRIVDVFIHLSTLGASETLYSVSLKGKSNVKSRLILDDPTQSSDRWVFKEAYIKIENDEINIFDSPNKTFRASEIVSFRKLPDPYLSKSIGGHKGLDSMSVQEYMYSRALRKLNLNRQFEKAIKEVAIDCKLNKNGNIIRLEEYYTPDAINGMYFLEYLNYSTGDKYTRFDNNLFNIEQILNNVAKNSEDLNFKNVLTNETFTFKKSLIIPENIECETGNYKFNESIPKSILNLSVNAQLIPALMKIDIRNLKQSFYDLQTGKIKSTDANLSKKIDKFISEDSKSEKQKIIDKFIQFGIGDPETWKLYPLKLLKEEYSRFKFKR